MCVLLSNKQKILLLMTETGKEIAITSHSHSQNYAFVVFTTRDIHIRCKAKVCQLTSHNAFSTEKQILSLSLNPIIFVGGFGGFVSMDGGQ